MKVLITGAAGLVGRHAAQRFAQQHEVAALKHADLDITNREAVIRCVTDAKPALIINCAVVQVDDSEQDPAKAQAVNMEGPRALAEAANRVGAEVVHFGTQYTFAGEPIGRAAYTIKDDLEPVNLYGRTKVAGEAAVRDACDRSYIIRTSWVYGKGKKSFLCTVHTDLLEKKPVRAIVDIYSSTTYAVDLVNRILEIVSRQRYGTYHIVNGGVCSYYDFALEAGRLVGLTKDQLEPLIEVVREEEMNRLAPRPRYTPMRCLLSEELGLPPMRDWRAALAEYVSA